MCTRKQLLLLFCCIGCIGGFFYRFLSMDYLDKFIPTAFNVFQQPNIKQSIKSVFQLNSSLLELPKIIDWPEPPSAVNNFFFSTNPRNCDYRLLNPRDTYRVGEFLEVLITARDHKRQPKNYGGDFFQAKLNNTKVRAGVTGQVTDHGNGTYLAMFLLPWPGNAEVHIRLIHSSEAVDVLKRKRESDPGKVYFNGYFHYNDNSAVVECNLEVAGNDICKYTDPVSGDTWQCVRPQKMPCSSLVFHSMGGYRKVTNALEDSLLSGSVTDKTIPGSVPPINVQTDQSFSELISKLPSCRPGQESLQPSGFYYEDTWTSLVCKGRHFPEPSSALNCLRGKDIHMFGDSTLRQWFEYLERFIPSLKRIDLHVNYQSGPLIAVDADAGLVMRWRAHGLPIRTSKTMMSDLHYEAAHLAGIGGGSHTVILMTLWAHFTSYPLRVYLERLERVHQAISSLLFRSPETTVIIKSANTGYKSIFGSDWLSLQLDILLRAVFKGTEVIILDAWDMTSCHYLPDNIHPGPPVIKNQVDLMLSHICPQ
ncbi:NXPE family member 3-like isoform X1 [Bufo gargarizans]|uniref:NXPE family member 3-like isoform X1 n=2 Tax=Bufo gargarizans TaxID=30331 RepID=UPI001CF287A3|nr:NXPE family member 3-like isoform X1 [Bufo gargarizans]